MYEFVEKVVWYNDFFFFCGYTLYTKFIMKIWFEK